MVFKTMAGRMNVRLCIRVCSFVVSKAGGVPSRDGDGEGLLQVMKCLPRPRTHKSTRRNVRTPSVRGVLRSSHTARGISPSSRYQILLPRKFSPDLEAGHRTQQGASRTWASKDARVLRSSPSTLGENNAIFDTTAHNDPHYIT